MRKSHARDDQRRESGLREDSDFDIDISQHFKRAFEKSIRIKMAQKALAQKTTRNASQVLTESSTVSSDKNVKVGRKSVCRPQSKEKIREREEVA